MADGHGGKPAAARLEADQRVVGRAAAEIGDQYGRILLQVLGEVKAAATGS
jgi:hypothetical protein